MNNLLKFWLYYVIVILLFILIYRECTRVQTFSTHTNELQELLNNATNELVLISGDTYQENSQVTIPDGKALDINGATIEPLSGLWRSSWDGNLHKEDFLIQLGNNTTIKNGILDGVNQKGWGGIWAYDVDNYNVDNVTIKLFRFTCLNTFNCNNVSITNSKFWESSIQPDNWESKYLYWNYLYNANISYNQFSGVNGQRGLAGGGMGVKYNGNVFDWNNVEIHHNEFNLFPLHGWTNPESGNRGANYALEINSNYNGIGLQFYSNRSNTGISFMRKNVTTDMNNSAYLADNTFIMDQGATLCYEFENVHMTIERDYVSGATYTLGFFGKTSAPNYTRKVIVRNCVFDLNSTNNPQLLFANGAIETELFSMENTTIYCNKNPVQIFNNSNSIGNTLQNYILHKNIFVNKTSTKIPISNAPKNGWDISDNKFEGEWNLQEWTNNDRVANTVKETGEKPFPFYTSNYTGYGADFDSSLPPIEPPVETIDSILITGYNIVLHPIN